MKTPSYKINPRTATDNFTACDIHVPSLFPFPLYVYSVSSSCLFGQNQIDYFGLKKKKRLIIRSCPKLGCMGALIASHNHTFMWGSGLSAWILRECMAKSVRTPRDNVPRLLNNTCSRLSVGIPNEYVLVKNTWIPRDSVPILVNNCSLKWLHCALKPLITSQPYRIHTLN